MATSDGGDSDLPSEVCDIMNCIAICYKKDRCERECLHSERKVLSLDFKESEALRETVRSVYGPSLEYGNEQSLSFTDTCTKESKTVNR